MKYTSILAAIALLLSTSCEKRGITVSERLVGNWRMDRVTFDDDFNPFNNEHITDQYSGINYHFGSDNILTVSYPDNSVFTGAWWADEELGVDIDGDVSTGDASVYAELEDTSGQRLLINWTELSISLGVLRAQEQKARGTYKYRMKRSD